MPKFIMLVGLPGSGKSTLANQISEEQDADIFSSDAIREELCGNVDEQKLNDKVFQILHTRIKENLQKGNNCIYDATNISYKRRKGFLTELNKISCEKICILVATPYEVCLVQNNKRERKVPESVINRMYRNFDIPYFYEGWDYIQIYFASDCYKGVYGTPNQFITFSNDYNQGNEHHTLTLGEHCLKAKEYITNNEITNKYNLEIAALLHDCGKPFCKTYENKKGDIDKNAHYYDHEHVGSYNSLFYVPSIGEPEWDKLLVAILIRWHMQMHIIKKQPHTEYKYKQLLSDIYNDLEVLNNADLYAH